MAALLSRVLAGAALAALGGCLAELPGGGPARPTAQRRVEPVRLRPEDLPAATRAVLGAAILAIRQQPESEHPGVRFAPGVVERLQEPFDARGFAVADLTLLHHEQASDGRPGLEVAATLGFVDLFDRRAVTGIVLTFGPERQGVLIRSAHATMVPARVPRFELYLVPRSRLPSRWPETHAELYALVLREALKPAERPRWLDGSQDLVLVAVGKDRVEPTAPFRLVLADGGGRPVATASQRLVYAGFPVLVLGGRIRAGEPGSRWALVERGAAGGPWGSGEVVARFDLTDRRAGTGRAIPDAAPRARLRA